MHGIGSNGTLGRVRRPGVITVDAQPVHHPVPSTCSLPTIGMLFSAWQAMMQALQPMQELRSIAMPQAFRVYANLG